MPCVADSVSASAPGMTMAKSSEAGVHGCGRSVGSPAPSASQETGTGSEVWYLNSICSISIIDQLVRKLSK